MSDPFKILIDRLKGGQTHKIEEALDPRFLGPDEDALKFFSKVIVKGDAYVTEAHLIIHLKGGTKVLIPCAVCNQMTEVELKVDNFYHTEPMEEIKSAIFDYSEALREALLIELPRTVECNQGKCPERELIKPFLRSKERDDKSQFPFADLDIL
jgi:uncharacterized metal-binding protein YceD (DUF177 family)